MVPANNVLEAGTVPANNVLGAGTVPANNHIHILNSQSRIQDNRAFISNSRYYM